MIAEYAFLQNTLKTDTRYTLILALVQVEIIMVKELLLEKQI